MEHEIEQLIAAADLNETIDSMLPRAGCGLAGTAILLLLHAMCSSAAVVGLDMGSSFIKVGVGRHGKGLLHSATPTCFHTAVQNSNPAPDRALCCRFAVQRCASDKCTLPT